MRNPSVRAQVEDGGLLPLATGMLVFVPIVLVGNAIGALLRYPELGSAVLFPPYAALAAALVASPRRHWIWYILVAALAHAVASLPHWSLSWVLLADVANVARALVAAVSLRWLFNGIPRMSGVPSLFKFLASAVILAPAVGATIGAANLVLHGTSPTYWRPWTAWFLSNALTALMMLPGLLVAAAEYRTWRRDRVAPHRLAEALGLCAALWLTCIGIFLVTEVSPSADLTWVLFAPLPLVIWAALRFGNGGASLALTAVAGAAILGADRGTGPFAATATDNRVLSLQLFLLLTAIPVMCIAAVATERRGAVRLYRALLASVQDHVAILDARGIVLEANNSWQQFTDVHKTDALDQVRTGDDFLSACRHSIDQHRSVGTPNEDIPALRALDGAERVLAGASRRFEMEYEERGDTHEWYTVRIEALERPEGGVVVTRANVSARHHAQDEIARQRSELSHLARVAVLGQLSSAFAHELRQPLSAILANAETGVHLLHRLPLDAQQLTEIMNDIATQDQRAAEVIDGLRSLLKRGETHVQSLDTGALINEILTLAHSELIARRVSLTANVEANLPPLLADRVQVQQVLLNLIINACDAMSEMSAGDRTLLVTAAATDAGDVHFAIRDAGTGIPLTLFDRLFDSFVTTKADGLGLGLSIARSIVVAHNGRIWAENNANGGATFHCVFRSARGGGVAATPRTLVQQERQPRIEH